MPVRDPDHIPYAIVLAELRQDWSGIAALIKQVQETATLRAREDRESVADALLNALALSLHHVYSAVEACLGNLAKYLDQHLRNRSARQYFA